MNDELKMVWKDMCPVRIRTRNFPNSDVLSSSVIFSSIRRLFKDVFDYRMKWAGHVIHRRKVANVYKISAGKPERKRTFGRPSYRWN
jgi:hypothetical protein